jgi:hypothetical protein
MLFKKLGFRLDLVILSGATGEFVHPSMIYFMKIHSNMRRLAVGAALSEAG